MSFTIGLRVRDPDLVSAANIRLWGRRTGPGGHAALSTPHPFRLRQASIQSVMAERLTNHWLRLWPSILGRAHSRVNRHGRKSTRLCRQMQARRVRTRVHTTTIESCAPQGVCFGKRETCATFPQRKERSHNAYPSVRPTRYAEARPTH